MATKEPSIELAINVSVQHITYPCSQIFHLYLVVMQSSISICINFKLETSVGEKAVATKLTASY